MPGFILILVARRIGALQAICQRGLVDGSSSEPVGQQRRQSRVVLGNDMKFSSITCFVACIAGQIIMAPAEAADSFFMGSWKVSGTVVAPWADPGQKPDSAEPSRLLGQSIVFKAKEITGPPPFACKATHYKESDFAADMIFQGAFEEMQSKNKSVDPNSLAAALGFTGNSIKTLETGCEIDFHFVDATTAEIGLNDRIYTLKKQ
jgi:hypothetical protein